ncbi:hypothetical protein ACQ86N_47605 [Puia sp. P3]|uniref:hypothetical protein n=1 Tax=Puia sp. P3 TaxID=3423952 RepID=UPI003D6640E9
MKTWTGKYDNSRRATDGIDLGDHDTTYKIPAEIRKGLFHQLPGVLSTVRSNQLES